MSPTTLQRAAPESLEQEQQRQKGAEGRHEASGCLVRVYWMLLGNALVALFAYGIAHQRGAITGIDVFYWLGAVGLVAARYVDVRFLGGTTAEIEPATMKHWRHYSLRVLAVSLAVWLAAHGLGYLAVVK